MGHASGVEAAVEVPPEQLQAALTAFVAAHPTTAERIRAAEAALQGPAGPLWRKALGQWATWLVPVEQLVPEAYRIWRPLVRDAMQFFVTRLSPARLAPKVIEQIELPPDMPAELRLLRLIAKVPGLQKIGQVLARNRHFDPRFRRALSQLENSISDVTAEEIRSIILRQLGPRIERYRVKLDPAILSEASVSAVVRFTWWNPEIPGREQGVFKVLKPHIPSCYAEDMKILQQLAGFLARQHAGHRSQFAGVAETLTEIRLLLGHEVDFRREQRTLEEVHRVYGSMPGVRVPRLIEPLSTATITALTHEDGVKVTRALRRQPARRVRLGERLAEALLAGPALARGEEALFHGDPHAGNVLYDARRDELVILDWALSERLSRAQRRHVALLASKLILRDADGISAAIDQLRLHPCAGDAAQAQTVRETVALFLRTLPLCHAPGAIDALRLLDQIATAGIRFPAPLVMFRKAAFTLDGVIEDVAGTTVRLDSVLARYALKHWLSATASLWSLLSPEDWLALQWSALTFAWRVGTEAVFRRPLSALLPHAIAAAPTSG